MFHNLFMTCCLRFNSLFHNVWTFFLFWLVGREDKWKKLARMKLKRALQTCVKDPEWHPFKFNISIQLSLQLHPLFILDVIMGHVHFWNILWVDMLLLLLTKKCMLCVVYAIFWWFFFIFYKSYLLYLVCCLRIVVHECCCYIFV